MKWHKDELVEFDEETQSQQTERWMWVWRGEPMIQGLHHPADGSSGRAQERTNHWRDTIKEYHGPKRTAHVSWLKGLPRHWDRARETRVDKQQPRHRRAKAVETALARVWNLLKVKAKSGAGWFPAQCREGGGRGRAWSLPDRDNGLLRPIQASLRFWGWVCYSPGWPCPCNTGETGIKVLILLPPAPKLWFRLKQISIS